MTPDELRALADALEPMARAPRFEDFDVPGFCAWVRACADAQPVRAVPIGHALSAVRHVGSANYPDRERAAIERLYSAEFDAYAHPAPAAPQAEPCIGNDPICPCQDGDACHYKDAADGTKAWPVPQAEPKREPLSDEQIAEITKKAARRSALRHDRSTSARIARAVERAHGIGGSDER